jgi:catechol 2,3-dioxygenase-like lactoylglutathione lyase family enzyme
VSPAAAAADATPPFERYSFVAVTTTDLDRARKFWVGAMGCRVIEEVPEDHFLVDVGGLRLCVDAEDGDVHRAGGGDPVIGLRVADVKAALVTLAARGVAPVEGPTKGARGSWARLVDPDGRGVVLTESD